jgi:hypothetical protein
MEVKDYVYTSRTANFKVDELQDLKGRRVAIQKGNVWTRNIAATIEDVTIVEFATDTECISKAVSGDVDAAISSHPITIVSKTVGIGAKIAYVIHEHPLPLVFSVRKDWPELVEIINKGLAAITQEEESQVWARNKEGNIEALRAYFSSKTNSSKSLLNEDFNTNAKILCNTHPEEPNVILSWKALFRLLYSGSTTIKCGSANKRI